MFYVKSLLLLLSVIGVVKVNCILTKTNSNVALDKNDVKKSDNAVAQSIDRDYIAGYEDSYGHGSHGLSAHGFYGDGHDGYGVVESSKHHIHHTEDHHHHHHDHHDHYDHHDHHDHHKHYGYDHHKALAIKSLLVPLAGVALLGAAAAFVSNPILLQLGVISGTPLGRKKRDLNKPIPLSREDENRLNEIKLLEEFMAQIPKQNIEAQEKKMLANYFSCTGTTIKNICLERLACELHSKEGTSMPMEANVLSIVVNEILDNSFIAEETKIGLLKAIERGRKNLGCEIYECQQMEKRKNEFNNGKSD